MSDERATGEKWSLPAAERTRIDRLADEFEREFNEGIQPRIEAYVEQAPELRSYLLDELIRVEVELRYPFTVFRASKSDVLVIEC
ncbi:MAG: hypothetical protein ACQESR_30410 [Planctomycetota bacterium]